MPSQLFEEADEVGHVLITQLKSNLVHLIGGSQKVALGFQKDLLLYEVGNGFSEQAFCY